MDARITANEQLETYVDQSMSSSYESGLHVNHSCNDQGTNRTVIDGIDGDSHDEESMFEQASDEAVLPSQNVTNRVGKADDVFFDYDGNSSEKKINFNSSATHEANIRKIQLLGRSCSAGAENVNHHSQQMRLSIWRLYITRRRMVLA